MTGLERMYLEYLFLAYAAAWMLSFGFLFRMNRRTRQMEQELLLMRDMFRMTSDSSELQVDETQFPGPSV